MSTNLLSDLQLRTRYMACFAAGLAIALLAYAAPRWVAPAPVDAPAPQILLQKESQTIARIPTRRDGKRIDCTVTIDQAKNVWSITC